MKRFLSAVLAAALAAQPAFAAGGQRSVPVPRVVSAFALPSIHVPTVDLSPKLSRDSIGDNSVVPAAPISPASLVPQSPASQPLAPQPLAQQPVAQKIDALTQAMQADAPQLAAAGAEGSRNIADAQMARLTGDAPTAQVSRGSDPVLSSRLEAARSFLRKAPQDPKKPEPSGVRWMMLGTPAFKLGAEVVTLSIPLLALKTAGTASTVAGLVVVYQLAQAAGGSLAGVLTRRFPASKVLAASVLTQGVLIATLLGLGAAHVFAPWMLFPIYGGIGAAIGVADTARKAIPALLLGQDEDALRQYNARLHRRYEIAGVIGAAGGGALIGLVGPLWAMAIQPPAYILSAWLFARVSHPHEKTPGGSGGPLAGVRQWAYDLARGAKVALGTPRFRWLAVAMILPQIVHRVFENLLVPVYAKNILGAGALAAALLTASNFGELGGASFLLKRSGRHPGAAPWVRWAGLGLFAGWALTLGGLLPLWAALVLILPSIFVFSATWAGSQLSLESDIQNKVSVEDQPRVIAFLNGLYIVGAAASSFFLGRFLDQVGVGAGVIWLCAGFTLLGLALLRAAKRLR